MNERLERLLQEITDPNSKEAAKALFESLAGTAKEGDKIEAALLAVRRAFVDVNTQAREFTQSFAASLQEITKSSIAIGQARKAQKGLLGISQKLQDNIDGTNRLSAKELGTLRTKAGIEKQRLIDSFNFLKNELGLQDLTKENAAARIEELKAEKKINEEQASILRSGFEDFGNVDKFIESIGLATADQEELNKMLGLSGVVLDNLNRIGVRAFGGLGLNLGALEGRLKEAKEAAIETAEELRLKQADGEIASLINKFKIFGSTLPSIGKGLSETLVDPLLISGKLGLTLIDAFKKIDKAQTDFVRTTGQRLPVGIAAVNGRFADTIDLLTTAGELTNQLGLSANNIFSNSTLAAVAEAKNLIGLSGEEAGKLAILSQATGNSFDSNLDTLVDSVSSFNKLNKTAVAQGIALKDIANTSEDVLVSFNGQTSALGEAAAAARRLGLDLSRVNEVASGLLDFESSIENELQAQLMTGRDINLAKAREFALTNDLAGLSNELFANSASIAEFSNDTRLAQEAQAAALGLSRQELAKIALQRSIQLGLTNKQLEAAAGITAEDLKRATVQEKLNKAVNKLAQALVGPAEYLANMADNANFLYKVIGGIATLKLGALISQLFTVSMAAAGASAGAIALVSALSFGAAALAVTYGINRLVAEQKRAKAELEMDSIQDGVIDYNKGLVVSGPKGSIQLNKQDQVIAGTNLTGGGGGSTSMRAVERKLDELISAVKAGGNVYIDGNKAGEALVLGTYKA